MKVKIELALADWRETKTNESVYFAEKGVNLTEFDLHSGTIFDGEIELDVAKTKIEWTQHSWNPVTGCTKISAGCKNCYAERMARRLAGRHGYPEAPHHFDVTLRPDRLEQPLERQKPTTYFVCSMSDLFHHEVPITFVKEVWNVMAACPQHTFQILTKRARLMNQAVNTFVNLGWTVLPNVWGGVSVEGPDYLWRIDRPVLDESAYGVYSRWQYGLDWCIAGCESGSNRRPMQLDWARDLRDQCQSAGVPFFFKQAMIDGKMVKLPELDGRQWAEMPKCL